MNLEDKKKELIEKYNQQVSQIQNLENALTRMRNNAIMLEGQINLVDELLKPKEDEKDTK